MTPERIDKLFAGLGYGSRTEARKWARAGRIMVNGVCTKDVSQKVDPALLKIDDEEPDTPGTLMILMNKPAGLVCSHSSSDGPRIYDILPDRWQKRNPPLSTVGRLDKDTTGAIIITDDTRLVHILSSPKKAVPKVYKIVVDEDISAMSDILALRFAAGTIMLENDDRPCLPAKFEPCSDHEFFLTITEGRFHQVKRMCATIGLTVDSLHRVSFAGLDTTGLDKGEFREITLDDIPQELLA